MPQLTETEINIRRQTLEKDLETVKEGLNKIDAERTNLVAQHHAISGAIQQCDIFLEYFYLSPTSSIPSQDNSAVSTALS